MSNGDNKGDEARSLTGNLHFILGGVSSHGKTLQQGCVIIWLRFLNPLWRTECRTEAG